MHRRAHDGGVGSQCGEAADCRCDCHAQHCRCDWHVLAAPRVIPCPKKAASSSLVSSHLLPHHAERTARLRALPTTAGARSSAPFHSSRSRWPRCGPSSPTHAARPPRP
eukprot:7391422-Prymnesium_polylepis.5